MLLGGAAKLMAGPCSKQRPTSALAARIMVMATLVSTASSAQLRLLNFSFANGSLLSPMAVEAPPMCPANHSMCSFDEVLKDPTTAKDFSKERALRASFTLVRSTILKLLDILEGAAQATGLVKGNLFSSAGSDAAAGTAASKTSFLIRERRQAVGKGGDLFTSLCHERVLPGEYPDIGRNERGEWRYLTGRQLVQYTYCINEGGACAMDVTLDSPDEVTRCVQKFGFAPMLVFDQQTQKFTNERIVVPCGCQCRYGRP